MWHKQVIIIIHVYVSPLVRFYSLEIDHGRRIGHFVISLIRWVLLMIQAAVFSTGGVTV
jgi:hypothetical protein